MGAHENCHPGCLSHGLGMNWFGVVRTSSGVDCDK
jgi:hypothetical protein